MFRHCLAVLGLRQFEDDASSISEDGHTEPGSLESLQDVGKVNKQRLDDLIVKASGSGNYWPKSFNPLHGQSGAIQQTAKTHTPSYSMYAENFSAFKENHPTYDRSYYLFGPERYMRF